MDNKWVKGARPKTLPAAIVPVALGTAAAQVENFSTLPAVLALLIALTLQVGVNYANDYSDGIRGNDGSSRVGPTRLVGSGLASASQVLRASIIMFTFSAASGLWLALISSLWLLPIGVLSILGAWFYTGGSSPYGYRALGEASVFLFFGLIATNGSFFVQVEKISLLSFILSCVAGLLSCGLLTVNNLRDRENDSGVGKRTLSVVLGEEASKKLFTSAIFVSFFLAISVSFWSVYALIVLLAIPLGYKMIATVKDAHDATSWSLALRQMSILQIVLGALLVISLVINS